jgi:hypothetical protein
MRAHCGIFHEKYLGPFIYRTSFAPALRSGHSSVAVKRESRSIRELFPQL